LNNRKQETGNRRQETGNRRQETGSRRRETGNRKQGDWTPLSAVRSFIAQLLLPKAFIDR